LILDNFVLQHLLWEENIKIKELVYSLLLRDDKENSTFLWCILLVLKGFQEEFRLYQETKFKKELRSRGQKGLRARGQQEIELTN